MQVMALGLEAVPALINHLDDRRLTRTRFMFSTREPFEDGITRIGTLADGLLHQLAYLPSPPRDKETRAQFYRAWWEEVNREGVEDYLAKNLWPDPSKKDNKLYLPYLNLLYRKYPECIPRLYREILANRPHCCANTIAEMIARGPYSKDEKIRWLMLGVQHKHAAQRTSALTALAIIDKKRFESAWLELMQVNLQEDVNWEESPFCTGIAPLVRESDDPKVWELLEKVTKKAPIEHRGKFLDGLFWICLSENTKCQIHFLLPFLDDNALCEDRAPRSRRPNAKKPAPVLKVQIRNLAAMKLAALWDLTEEFDLFSPEDWQKFREKVRVLGEAGLREK